MKRQVIIVLICTLGFSLIDRIIDQFGLTETQNFFIRIVAYFILFMILYPFINKKEEKQ